jgi:hypothetical protein
MVQTISNGGSNVFFIKNLNSKSKLFILIYSLILYSNFVMLLRWKIYLAKFGDIQNIKVLNHKHFSYCRQFWWSWQIFFEKDKGICNKKFLLKMGKINQNKTLGGSIRIWLIEIIFCKTNFFSPNKYDFWQPMMFKIWNIENYFSTNHLNRSQQIPI